MKSTYLTLFAIFLFMTVQSGLCQKNTSHSKPALPQKSSEKWISIFNGINLEGWTPKVTGSKAGENTLDVFRVEDSILKVDYSKYEQFKGRFGHLFYKDKLSSYKLRLEYRLTGNLLSDAPSYCYRNSGVMIHSQSAESMAIDQNWPVSLETQILGSTDSVKQKTANVCTPGTTVYYQGKFTDEHCIASSSKYYKDGEWVKLEIIVHGSRLIQHIVNGDTVLSYSKPQIGGFLLPEHYPLPTGTVLKDGYIALQAEGQPIDFRKIELMILPE